MNIAYTERYICFFYYITFIFLSQCVYRMYTLIEILLFFVLIKGSSIKIQIRVISFLYVHLMHLAKEDISKECNRYLFFGNYNRIVGSMTAKIFFFINISILSLRIGTKYSENSFLPDIFSL